MTPPHDRVNLKSLNITLPGYRKDEFFVREQIVEKEPMIQAWDGANIAFSNDYPEGWDQADVETARQ